MFSISSIGEIMVKKMRRTNEAHAPAHIHTSYYFIYTDCDAITYDSNAKCKETKARTKQHEKRKRYLKCSNSKPTNPTLCGRHTLKLGMNKKKRIDLAYHARTSMYNNDPFSTIFKNFLLFLLIVR